jgi:cytochrome c553
MRNPVSKSLPLAFIAVALSAAPALALPPATQPSKPPTKEQVAFFESKVRPLLVAHCYKCHSVEEKKSKGGLVLDTRDGWQKGGENGPVIIPGDVKKSKLLIAIRHEDPDLEMPPKVEKLADADIAVLEQWVKMGAPDPREATPEQVTKLTGLNDAAKAHWAYQPVKPQQVPAASDAAWVKSPVDAFILRKLDDNGLKPSSSASKETLIRRATYDLIGLPPSPEEVKAFVEDQSPNAFEKVVDRLLASPHYGERWGRFWLDTARYSDTTGNEQEKGEYRFPFAWTYRDYVIKAFNEDKPYDQFLKEQIAADQLPESKDDPERLAALGFITVGKRFQNPNDTIDERIDAVTKGTMALTVACARCHDHKFDPIPTADYYALHGVFASTVEPTEKPLITTIQPSGPEYEDFKKQLAELQGKSRDRYYDIIKTKGAEFRKKASPYLLVGTMARKGATAEEQKARYELISKEKLDRDLFQGGLRGLRRDESVFGPLFQFAEIKDGEQFADRADEILEKIPNLRLRGRQHVNDLVVKAFADVKPGSLHELHDVTDVYGKLFASLEDKADAYIEACRNATTNGQKVNGFDDELVELLSVPTPIEPSYALTADRMRELSAQLPIVNQGGYARIGLASVNELMLTHPGSPARAMVINDAPRPHNSPIFIRGEQGNRGAIVPRRFLEILSGPNRKPFTQGSGRLELANAIATKDNPLTARVMINRIWMHHFGAGIVRTPDDLGVQSEPPSHPELLDYLAYRFANEDGWSVKRMHKLIMLSSVYQQSSETNPAFEEKDPDNRFLWHANIRRLDFEAVRDSMLMFTGKLDESIGGHPVNLTDEPYSNRRSVYGYIDRGNLPELMSQFDFADPDMTNSQRTSTIVPQQALFFMNSPMAVDAARKVTSRPEFVNAKDDIGRVLALYEVLYQRRPRPEEVKFAREFMRGLQSNAVAAARQAEADPEAAKEKKRESIRQTRVQERQKKQAEMANMKRGGSRSAIKNEGELVERKPLTPWEEYAQALLFTNELVYVN